MPIPILTVISQEKRATEISEELLAQTEEVLKVFGLEWRTEPVKRSPAVFTAISIFEPLDYDLKENEKKLEWSFGRAAPRVTIEVKSSELLASLPDTPYYSCHLYIWRSKESIVASPWWLLPAIAASSSEGLLINDSYVWAVTAWNYPLGCISLHKSVWKAPLGSVVRVGYSGVEIMGGVDYSGNLRANATELANLLTEGARNFLETIMEKGLKEVRVALSGGLDSRTVLGALLLASENIGVKVKAFTRQTPGTDPKEVEVAKKVAEKLGVEHHVEKTEPNLQGKIESILNPFRKGMALANGTGGDKTLSPLGHIRWSSPKGMKEMATKLVKERDYSVAVPPIHKYVRIAGKNMIRKLECEAQNPLELYRKYMTEYRIMNWLTSFNCPLVTPFLYPPFFSKSFKINPKHKDYFVLYAKVLEKLDSRLLQVPYYNLDCRLTSKALLQKIKVSVFFAWKAARKLLKGQRGALVPTELAWKYTQLMYIDFIKRIPLVDHPICKKLKNAIEWALQVKPKDARALSVANNMLRLLIEMAALNIAIST